MTCKEIKILVVREAGAEYKIRKAAEIDAFWRAEVETAAWYQAEKECLVVIMLNSGNMITGYNLVSLGLLDQSLAHPREVFRPALIAGAGSIILAHNHPSQSQHPSAADIQTTKELIEAGKIIGIKLLDHVILTKAGHFSLQAAGMIND